MNPADKILEMLENELPSLITEVKNDVKKFCTKCEHREECVSKGGACINEDWCLIKQDGANGYPQF